jgi:hypothetical protein
VEPEVIQVRNQTTWGRDQWLSRAEKVGLRLSGDDAQTLSEEDVAAALKADDVLPIARALRTEWRRMLRHAHVRTTASAGLPAENGYEKPFVTGTLTDQYDAAVTQSERRSPLYGAYAGATTEVKWVDKMRRYTKVGLMEWLRGNKPRMWEQLNAFHRSWHLSERVDYLLGSYAYAVKSLHPQLVFLPIRYAAGQLLPGRIYRRGGLDYRAALLEPVVSMFGFVRTLYRW